MEVAIDELFSPDGALARADPQYEHRPQQAAMAEAVFRALEREERLVVEAGTGVGKSLGYLLPGALWAARSPGRRLLVSTYTRALQEQLIDRELPVAARVMAGLGYPFRYAMLMGSDNYLCVQRLSRLADSPGLFEGDGAGELEGLAAWARTAKTGLRSSLDLIVPPELWSRVSRDPDLCLGPGGRYWERCLYRKDRERAERSQILVVNHALLLSGSRLPDYDALIIDEAHNLEDAAASHFGLAISESRYWRLLGDILSPDCARGVVARLKDVDQKLLERASGVVRECLEGGKAFFRQIAEAHGFDPREPGARRFSRERGFTGYEPLKELQACLHALSESGVGTEESLELKLYESRVGALRSDLETFLGEAEEDVAHWVQWPSGRLVLCVSPLEVGERLSQTLLARGIPVVMSSATLSAGNGLGAFKAHVGFEGARELVLDSPFDYESQAGLLIMDDLPRPADEEAYLQAIARRCREIIERVPGGLFILFSSWKSLRRVHELLRAEVTDRPLWAQGKSGSEALLAEFTLAGNAVLLGVDTFWQGVDVPGAALSCVVMVKLPFPNFGSPVEEVRREYFESLGRSYFDDHSLPRAVMKFRQGFGRLIRSTSDRGAVVVLDSRVARRGYGAAFLEALPRCRRLKTLEELGDFFRGII